MIDKPVNNIVILGGGSAGWLTAGLIAAQHKTGQSGGLSVTLVESPNVSPIGVGEGTWPSMRATLKKIGISETDLFRQCDASFKQGAKFAKWVTGEQDDYYYHPLVLPHAFHQFDLIIPWQNMRNDISFGDAVCFQGALCEQGRAPKQISTPEYEGVANYAYHLNSEKLAKLLKKHCTEKLGVKHVLDHVVEIKGAEDGDIEALITKQNGEIRGDLFVDCSGFASVLLGQHYQIPFVEKKHILFNDRAIAVQVPYPNEDSPIASHTISTAQSAGWIWDIGLPTRRGVGSVYSSAHITDEAAFIELEKYLEASVSATEIDNLSFRKIAINPGHRSTFWHRNCVAVGMSAGFLEPLEASALVLIEISAAMISEQLPATRSVMDIVANRFNERLQHDWDSIVDFLKLHYVLTKRTDNDYWIDHVCEQSIPERLQQRLAFWRQQVPGKYDFTQAQEMFPAASWQYVLYGMGFSTQESQHRNTMDQMAANTCFDNVAQMVKKYLAQLPTNRELINKIHQYGLQKI